MRITFAAGEPKQLTREEKMEKAIQRLLNTAQFITSGSWHVSSDNIEVLKEALK